MTTDTPLDDYAGHTPGPWEMWTGCSYRRIGAANGGVCEPTVQRSDGHPDLHFRNGGFEGPDARLMVDAPKLLQRARELERDLSECRAALRGVMVALEVQRVDEALATLSAEQLAYIAGEVVKQAKEATQMRAALRELVVLDARPGIVSMNPIHRYHCPCTRHGSKFGPCDCDGDEAHGQIERAWSAARAILAKGEGK